MRTKIRGMPKLIALSAMLITTAVTTLYKPMETYAYDSAWGYTADSHTATAQVNLTYKDGYCSGYTNENKRGGIPNANEYYLTKLQAHVKTNDGQYLGHIVYGAHYHNTGWTNYLRQDEQDLTENDDRWIEALTFYLDPQEGVGADRQISNFYYVKYSTYVQPVTEPYYHDHTNASYEEERDTWNKGYFTCNKSEANQREMHQDGGENDTSYFPEKWDPRNWSGTAGQGLPIVGAAISLERYPCKVTVKPNGGSWNGSTDNSSATFSAGDSLNLANPTREGYTFTGWTIGSDGGYPTESAYNCYQVPDDSIAPTVDGSSVYCGNADHFSVVANWKKNTYKQIVKVRYQEADGSWGAYSDVINADYTYGSTVSWSREADDTYKAASVSYTVTEAKTSYVDVYRKQYRQIVKVRYQNADGTWGSYSDVINTNYYYGATVSWSREEDARYEAKSVSYTVSGEKTTNLDVKRRSYNQTINYYYNKASGTYNSPTHTKTLLGSKSWSQLYETTFNAKDHKADWGNVDGYHWSSIDSESWTVKGTASTNSYYSANVYRLSVDKKDGSDVATYDMEYGTNIDLGTPTRTGWAFKGWEIVTNNSTNSTLSSNTFTMGYNNSYKYQTYVAVPTVKIIANWEDVTAPAGNDTILKATNPTKTTTYASVTASTPKADTPWVNNNVLSRLSYIPQE